MSSESEKVSDLVKYIRDRSYSLNEQKDLEPLIQRIGGSRIVMLGEATHGTHEFYTWRSYISKKLIGEKGFNFIAVEGDWPDCYEVNCFVKSHSNDNHSTVDLLRTFDRWPTWMWANWETAALVEWLRKHNGNLSSLHQAGFYGLDVYSLWDSMNTIVTYLEKHDPNAVEFAREAFRCFEPHAKDQGQGYARSLQFVPDGCEHEVLQLLREIRKRPKSRGNDREEQFNVEQNALVAVNAERYYRAMLEGSAESWNVRDRHMTETLERLLDLHGPESKAIVWEHNTHIGDARATDMAAEGMVNIGQLARERYGEHQVALVGFGTYEGSVMAGKSWGAPMEKMDVPPGRPDSWEYYLHEASEENKLLILDDFKTPDFTDSYIDHRAIGVVYRPAYEKYGNYVPTVIPMRYDAFVYIDRTKAVHPMHIARGSTAEAPDTYPFGL